MADKYIELDKTTGNFREKEATTTSSGAADAGKIVALGSDGRLDSSLLPTGIGEDATMIEAYEALSAGDFVNVFDDGGTVKVRKADASSSVSGKPAHGFVLTAVNAGEQVKVYFEGFNTALTGLTPGSRYYLDPATPGGVTDTPPNESGKLFQSVGVAISATTIDFERGVPIELA